MSKIPIKFDFWSKISKKLKMSENLKKVDFWSKILKKIIFGRQCRKISKKTVFGQKYHKSLFSIENVEKS